MVLDAEEATVLDANAAFLGVPAAALMRNAGEAIARVAERGFSPQSVLFFCGPGNNGGDGFTAASRLQQRGVKVACLLLAPARSIRGMEARDAYEEARRLKVPLYAWGDPNETLPLLAAADLVVDAMLGSGQRGELRSPYQDAAELINGSGKRVLAVDVPTGLGGKSAVKPMVTVTFHDAKRGMSEENAGSIVVEPIGIPEKASTHLGPGDLLAFYPKSKPESHKGMNGRVLIVGGGPFHGAPALAGLGALKTGADLVHIACPSNIAPVVSSFAAEFIVHRLPGDSFLPPHTTAVGKILDKVDAVLVGPGLGEEKQTLAAVRKVCSIARKEKLPLVVDADAFKALEGDPKPATQHATVFTPHAREFLRLSGLELPHDAKERAPLVRDWAKRNGATVLLKGPVDVVTDGAEVRFNDVHTPAMTHGGTGDVLAGVTVALLAKGLSPFRAARAACFLNGYAGVKAFHKASWGLTASDLVASIPEVLREVVR